jgi:hypothetical protein
MVSIGVGKKVKLSDVSGPISVIGQVGRERGSVFGNSNAILENAQL